MAEFKNKEEYEKWKTDKIAEAKGNKEESPMIQCSRKPLGWTLPVKILAAISLVAIVLIIIGGLHNIDQSNIKSTGEDGKSLSAQIYKLNYDYAYKSGLEGGKDEKNRGLKYEPEIVFTQPVFQSIIKIFSDKVVDQFGEAYRQDAEKGLKDGLMAGYRDGFNAPDLPQSSEHRIVEEKTLGITYDQTMAYLSNHFVMQKGLPINGKDNYVGRSALGLLQLIGNKSNLSEASITIGISKDTKVFNEYNSLLSFRFLKNIFPNWTNMDSEITDSMKSLLVSPDKAVTIFRDNKRIEIELFKETGMLCLTVKPF